MAGYSAIQLLGSTSTNSSSGIVNTLSCTHTLVDGRNRIAILLVLQSDGAVGTVTSATFAGNAMTQIGTSPNTAGAQDTRVDLWRYVIADGESSGSKTVTANLSVNCDDLRVLCAVFNNVNSTTPIDVTANTNSATGTSHTDGVTTVTPRAMLLEAVILKELGRDIVEDSEQISIASGSITGSVGSYNLAYKYIDSPGVANLTSSFYSGGLPSSCEWAVVVGALRPIQGRKLTIT